MVQIQKNMLKLVTKIVSAEDAINDIYSKIRSTYGKEPQTSIYGMVDGGTIFVITLDDKIISHIGFTIKYDKDGKQQTSLVDLQNLK